MATKTSTKSSTKTQPVNGWPIEAKAPVKKAPAKRKVATKAEAPALPPLLQAAALIAARAKGLSIELDKAKAGGAAELARLYSTARLHYEIVGEAMKGVGQLVDLMNRVYIPEAFENEKISTLTDADTGDRVTITQRMLASIPADNRELAYAWLRENGHESLITETVNASSLSAFAKTQMEAGFELPDEIFKTTIMNQVSLTRGKKSKVTQ